jgi:hypothetical protein
MSHVAYAYEPNATVNRGYANTLVPAAGVCSEFGICRRTLTRWTEDAGLRFPTPTIIKGRWFFQRAAVESWKLVQAKKSAEALR